MDVKKVIKTGKRIAKIIPFVTAGIGIVSLALSKYEEKQGNYSREFPEIENEMKTKIDEVNRGYGRKE